MSDTILESASLQTPWQTANPFLFCMHHDDRYPPGNEEMGPDASLEGRNLGNDFSGKDGWSMYHGRTVPGFPRHPHRGFETITIARNGFIDHADSLGATARFGEGDVQWMTAGNGIVHSEAFPLLDRENPNHTELLQIWLNLPREAKDKDAYFTMFWNEQIPRRNFEDDQGRCTEVAVIAGEFDGAKPLAPPPTSWASHDEADVAVWTVTMEAGADWTLPSADAETNRALYFFEGDTCQVAGEPVEVGRAVELQSDRACEIVNGDETGEFLVLQGRPIEEPVVQQGPFVMNSRGGIRDTMLEYQRDGFGGWSWDEDGLVHPRDAGRFAIHIDGTEERPEQM